MPRVSVVIPAYNAARTVGAAVESALRQTEKDLEVLVVDDGSSDRTADVVRSIRDPRVRLIVQENGGAAAARNAGIRASSGEYVALLDADDWWLPSKLARQLALLASDSTVHAVQCGAYFVDDELRILQAIRCTDTGRSFEEALVFQNLPAFLSALLVRRDRLLEVGLFDTRLVILEEWDMALKMARFCRMRSVEDPLVLYRVHPGNRHRNVGIHIEPGLIVLRELFADRTLPPAVRAMRRRAYGVFYRTLAGGYYNNGEYLPFVRWAAKSLLMHPAQLLYMAQLPLRRLRRRRSVSLAPASAAQLLSDGS